MSAPKTTTKAKFFIQKGNSRQEVTARFFNPVSLQYSVANTLTQQNNDKQQYVNQSTAKLTMDLIFDTTDTGTDVRLHTNLIANLMEPKRKAGKVQRALPDIVVFEWGLFSFQGMVESYKETIDFFSAAGVPLRASVNLTLSRQEKVFTENPRQTADGNDTAVKKPPLLTAAGETAMTDLVPDIRPLASEGLRRIGAANMLESLRHVTEALSIPPSLPPAGGAGANAALALGLGGPGSGSGALSLRVGGALSAGVAASAGAFAGLRVSAGFAAPIRVDLDGLLSGDEASASSVAPDAEFRLGGQAEFQGGASFKADVGATVSLRDQLLFDE